MVKTEQLKDEALALQSRLIAWRRDFHMHPELSLHEVRTAGIVADHLRQLGLEVMTGIGGTGVVAMVEPDNPPANAAVAMLRFDMDALPIQEENNLPYTSQNPGVMHACGHDAHTAIGMGVAQMLTAHRQELKGRIKLVFQPAEEALGGALRMINDGVLTNPTPAAAFGLHIWSRLPLNQVIAQAGPLWAGADRVDVTVVGRGGHGAMPHETIDAIVVASELVLAWQTIVARSVNPTDPAVITVGVMQAGDAANVIAERAELKCSIRSLNFEMRDFLLRRMEEVTAGICAAYGAHYTFTFTAGVPATINSVAGAALLREVAMGVVGADHVTQITPMMVGEDMSEFLNRAPGCFVLLGAWDPDKPMYSPHHSPTFDFDERVLSTGVALLTTTAFAYLAHNAQ